MRESKLPGPPHLIEAAKAEAYREILEKAIEIAPDVVYEAAVHAREESSAMVEVKDLSGS